MTVEVKLRHSTEGLTADTVVVLPLFTGESPDATASRAGLNLQFGLSSLPSSAIMDGRYETTLIPSDSGRPHVLFVGAGRRSSLEPLVLVRIAASASRYLTGRRFESLCYVEPEDVDPCVAARAMVEGALRGIYDPGLRKSKERKQRKITHLTFISHQADSNELRNAIYTGRIVGESSALARDLVNLPPNELNPVTFADRARSLAEAEGLHYEVLDESAMKLLGMGAILGVGAGSDVPPRLFSMKYGDSNAPIRLAFVGKGITFDSGGLAIKPANSMETMKGDMGGAAAVVSGLVAVARLKPENIAVTGYVGSAENMLSGRAMRPGDVLTAMTGETIEVLNPDAEGRLVLADVLAYAVQQGATHLVDFATLTGAANVALGSASSLATGRPAEWVAEVVDAARSGLERAWPMPLYEDYRRNMDSNVADIKNSGPRGGGALNAAAFLSDFVGDVPWAHVDIAGTSWSDEAPPYAPKGGTGVGVGTIAALAQKLAVIS